MSTDEETQKSANDLAVDRTNLAYERTALANDRTLMAWVRTATSLTSFGFTIYKFFSDVVKMDTELATHKLVKPVDVGMILISFGFLGLLFGLMQYHSDMKRLRGSYTIAPLKSFTPVLAMLMLIFSLLLLIVTLFRQ
jgi:putative membrane protein